MIFIISAFLTGLLYFFDKQPVYNSSFNKTYQYLYIYFDFLT